MNKKDIKLMSIFNDVKDDSIMIDSIVKIQNSINIYASSKVIAVAAATTDISLSVVSRALAEVYAMQNQQTILIDCNMYNPTLNNLFDKSTIEIGLNNIKDEKLDTNKLINHISKNFDAIFTNEINYPTEVFKSSQYINFINSVKEHYEHIILVMPELIEHQDILMNKDLITATLLVARKNRVSKKDLFESIQTLEINNIPYVGTIYLK